MGLLPLVKVLVEARARVNVGDEDGFTPLMGAAASGFTEIVRFLVASGAEVDLIDEYSRTPLVWAVTKGDFAETANELLNRGANPDHMDKAEVTLLMRSALMKHPHCFVALLKAGANPSVQHQPTGKTAHDMAIESGCSALIADLMGTGLQVKHEEATIKAFVMPDKQERFLTFLSKPKTRKKLTQELGHFKWFEPRFASPIAWKVDPTLKLSDRHAQGIASVSRLLKSKGAGKTCWVISESPDVDAKELYLESALEAVFGRDMGTILSCIPGRLALYAGEDETLLLSR